MAEMQEYWRWTEYDWHSPEIEWRRGKRIAAGIDVGSVSSQALVLVDGQIFAFSNLRTGSNSPDSAHKAINGALKDTGMELSNIKYTVGTGYGRVNVPFANRAITEIACHARGANFMAGPKIRTVLDMGGQDCKAIHCDERGKVSNFLMNDKCAAGTGRGMEVMADLLSIPIKDIGDLSYQVDQEPQPVSSTCVVFAKSERVSLLLGRIGVEDQFFITGGIAKNPGVVKRLEKELGIQAVKSKYDSQIAGALGAALFADTLLQKGA
ncbi:MAG: benzoyl-CoA reductase, bzd-type, subunit Q [Deltaproteobacteria bacterium]|nr:benzoyl-CoA reductase, bzd-type, subunit Q [Deltaproteobacteria bacterium]